MEPEYYSTFANEPINPATEIEYSNGEATPKNTLGLTKREYFASLAMQGVLANGQSRNTTPSEVAEYAVYMADVLIEQLNKEI